MRKVQARLLLAVLAGSLLALGCAAEGTGAAGSGELAASAGQAYDTYFYSREGYAQKSPHAMVPERVFDTKSLGIGALSQPGAITTDSRGNIYISDTGNNRIVVLNADWSLKRVVDTFQLDGVEQTFKKPLGCFVDEDGQLVVADSENHRLVRFDETFACTGVIGSPDPQLLPADFTFVPSAVAVDRAGRMYVLSRGSVYGIMALNIEGGFESFIGAKRVTPNLMERFWRMFMTDEQKRRTVKTVPTNYNNLELDENGFLFATTVNTDAYAVAAAIRSGGSDNQFLPVRLLNYNGEDILVRSGVFPPAGDVDFEVGAAGIITDMNQKGPSTIVDVAVGKNGCYTLADEKRGKIFAYDGNGNLLYAFGGTGYQNGLFVRLAGITYQGDTLLALDGGSGRITAFVPTAYGRLLASAIDCTENRRYDEAVEAWREIRLQNNGFDLAYVGIAESLMRQNDYTGAMSYYKNADDVEGYSKAFGQYRKDAVGNYVLLLPLAAALLVAGILFFFKFCRRYNAAHAPASGRYGAGSQVMYGFHAIFRPFDGFWDIKHEKRGGLPGALIILGAVCVSMIVRDLGTGYIFAGSGRRTNALIQAGVIIGLVLLWCIANWCLTSLMNGEGTFRDIFIMVCYALLPLVLMNIPATLLSHVLTEQEGMFITFFTGLGFIWAALLIFAGTMSVHGYSFGRNIVTVICTVIGMVLIAFIGALFINLLARLWVFFKNLYDEVSFRL